MVRPSVHNFLFDHLFLPPKLPQEDHGEYCADELLKQVSATAHVFSSLVDTSKASRVLKHLARSSEQWIELYGSGTPCRDKITESLKNMETYGTVIAATNRFCKC